MAESGNNEQLVKRGEYLLDLDFVERWNDELAITNYMQKNSKKVPKQEAVVEGDDTREGLIGIMSILMQNPEFEGQTKEKLGNGTIKTLVDSVLYAAISTYFEENPAEAGKVIGKVVAPMKLSKLTSLESSALMTESSHLQQDISGYNEILGNEKRIYGIIKEDMKDIKSKFGRDRRTKVEQGEDLQLFEQEDLISDDDATVILTRNNYVKRMPVEAYKLQSRGLSGDGVNIWISM